MSQIANRSIEPMQQPLWMQTTVQQFLSEVNWEGTIAISTRSPKSKTATPPDSSRVDPHAPLPMSLSVSQFLTSVNWDGAALVAVPLEPLSVDALVDLNSEESGSLTLNDFSDLF